MNRRQLLRTLAGACAARRTSWGDTAGVFETIGAERSRISWVHENARSVSRHLPETVGSGCAFLDYDNDGWMDIFLVNTGPCDFYRPRRPTPNALYRNNRDGTFTDVTRKAGLEGGIFGMGVAVGDYNGDGYPDLYLTGYGRNILYRNNGDGTFTDVTRAAGVADPGWSTSAVWFDYDNDGRLDLFVCNFIEYTAATPNFCGLNPVQKPFYCTPRLFSGRPSVLYHNNGDGTFTETGQFTAIGKNPGKAHGVVATDVNGDGLMDLFVANDSAPNFLFMNRGKGVFEEVGLAAGIAFNEHGRPRAGMGVDSADYDNDGRMDLFVANVDRERFSIYHNDGDELFTDRATPTRIGVATQLLSGWGLKFFDYDNDGNLDLVLANGHPDDMVADYTPGVRYDEPLLLFHNDGANWTNVSAQAGEAFQHNWNGRGLAVGDFDNDGALDLLINNNGGAPLLLRNRIGARNNWLGLKLAGVSCNRDAIGARITWRFGGTSRTRLKTGGGSFLSSHDPREVLGIGQAPGIDLLEIRWPAPSRLVDRFKDVRMNRYLNVTEGKGMSET
jgi:enediyne biosynthesis protein E4